MIDFELVGPDYLESRLSEGKSEIGKSELVILEAHFSSIDHPLDGDASVDKHIAGAIHIHPSYLESGVDVAKYYPYYSCPEDGNVLPHEQLVEMLERIGICPETEVVIYGTEPDGTMAAARLIWGLLYAGVRRVRLLDGGLDAWLVNGGEVVADVKRAVELSQAAATGESVGANWRARSELLATTEELKSMFASTGSEPSKLVDVRNLGEFNGTLTKYYPFFSKAGHIPGATFQGNWDNLLDVESHKVGAKLEDVCERWRELGIIDEDVEEGRTRLVFYCGTGWRSSLSFLIATLSGFRAANYDHGFYGWSWKDQNEVAYGEPELRERAG